MSPGTAHSLKHCRQSLFPREEYLHFLIGRQKAVGTPEILHYDLVAAAHLLRYIVPVLELLHHLLAQLLPQPQITCSLTAEHLVLAEIASEEKIQQDTYVGQHKHHKNPGKSLDGVPLVGNQLHRRIHGDSDIQNVKRRCEYWPELRQPHDYFLPVYRYATPPVIEWDVTSRNPPSESSLQKSSGAGKLNEDSGRYV